MEDLVRKSTAGRLADAAIGDLSPHKAGVALGTLMGAWHLLWAIVVSAGWGQPLLDFVFWMHFMKPVFVIDSFSFVRAVVLIAVTAAGGYCLATLVLQSGTGSAQSEWPHLRTKGTRKWSLPTRPITLRSTGMSPVLTRLSIANSCRPWAH